MPRFLPCLCLAAFAAVASSRGREADQRVVETLVDGKVSAGATVPASHRSVGFRGRRLGNAAEGNRRYRFRLEGIDAGWRETPSEMCFTVRFLNAAGDQIGQRSFEVSGRSPGWAGTVQASGFTLRQETVQVPASGTFATMAISSSGPPTAIGVYAVRSPQFSQCDPPRLPLGFVLLAPEAKASNQWIRTGTRPSMAREFATKEGGALGILDDDATAHAEWSLARTAACPVQPGQLLAVTWSELYSVGTANRFEVNYGALPPGRYRFSVESEDVVGTPLGDQQSIDFEVLSPFWKTLRFWLGSGAIAGVLVWLVCRAIIRSRIREHLARVEQERLIERERLRIAQDLHDDLGARLTHISLVSGLAESESQSEAARESFQRISGMARELVGALYQTVWTVNPENDHLEALVNYLGQVAERLCEPAGVRCRVLPCAVPSERRVTSELRHAIILAVKEAIHNAIKHAAATEIVLEAEFADPRLTIIVTDNGRGFDSAAVQAGHGLANMRRRIRSIRGRFECKSKPGAGCRVRFEVPLSSETLPSS